MATVVNLFGLRGRLEELRDWDYPTERGKFDRELTRHVAACFGGNRYKSMWRLSEISPGGRQIYEVTIGKRGATAFMPRATVFVTTEAGG